MKSSFLIWYTQALGATLGIISCIYAYLYGYMSIYSNIGKYFDNLGIDGVISSYFLLPLCILTLLLGIMKSYISNKKICNISLESINKTIIIITVIIGFLGAKIYFTIPAVLILFNIYSDFIHVTKNEDIRDDKNEQFLEVEHMFAGEKTAIFYNEDYFKKKTLEEKYQLEKSIKSLLAKRNMARDLLIKNADKQFIMEITGLTLKEINDLENESRK